MKFTNYIILTGIFEEYGKTRYNEGRYREAGFVQDAEACKIRAGEIWERGFKIINEMEGAHE